MKKLLDNVVASSSKIKFEESEESDESSSGEEEAEIEHELADISFEELQKARSDGTLALHQKRDSEKKSKRANKNRPAEVSSKKPVSKFREVVQAPKRVELRKLLKSSKDPEVIQELENRISWIDKQLKSDSTAKHKDSQILSEHKKKEREAAKQGKHPFYLKKSEIRKQRLMEKYNSLKASGKLDSYLEKRRRRNAAKDHRFMPYRRPNNDE